MRSPNALILFDTSHNAAGARDGLAPLGEDIAAELRAAYLVDAARRFSSLPLANLRILLSDVMLHPLAAAAAPSAEIAMQNGDTAAERLIDAFEDAFDAGHKHVLLVFADALHAPLRAIETAFLLLDTFDDALVLGPTESQDVYAIGLRHPNDTLLAGIAGAAETPLLAGLGVVSPDESAVYSLMPWKTLGTKDELVRFIAEAENEDAATYAATFTCLARHAESFVTSVS